MIREIWIKEYSNGPHVSLTKKDGFTRFVPAQFAVALFIREQLTLLLEHKVTYPPVKVTYPPIKNRIFRHTLPRDHIDELDLSVRAANMLHALEVHSIDRLIVLLPRPNFRERFKNNKKVLREIEKELARHT